MYLRDQASLSFYLSFLLIYFKWGIRKLHVPIFIFLSHYLCLSSPLGLAMENRKRRGKEYIGLDSESSFFRAEYFFSPSLDLFPRQASNKCLHKNHSGSEALKLVFWFSVGKDKIHVGYCWNKMYIWNSVILLWFLSFFFIFCSNCQGWELDLCCCLFNLSSKRIEVCMQNESSTC